MDSIQKQIWEPQTNLIKGKNDFTLEMLIPGVLEKDLSIIIENGILTIKGKRDFINVDYYLKNEIEGGRFSKTFILDQEIDQNQIDASLNNGKLRITLKRKEELKPKNLSVNIN